jgi:hypothetical protein
MAFVFVLSCCSPSDGFREKWRTLRVRRIVSKGVNLPAKKRGNFIRVEPNVLNAS